jgi:hypothetical protein
MAWLVLFIQRNGVSTAEIQVEKLSFLILEFTLASRELNQYFLKGRYEKNKYFNFVMLGFLNIFKILLL